MDEIGRVDAEGNVTLSEGEFFVWVQYRSSNPNSNKGMRLTVTRELPIEFVPSNVQEIGILGSELYESVPLNRTP